MRRFNNYMDQKSWVKWLDRDENVGWLFFIAVVLYLFIAVVVTAIVG